MMFKCIAALAVVFYGVAAFAGWNRYLDPPAEYAAFPRSVEKLATYSFSDFDEKGNPLKISVDGPNEDYVVDRVITYRK